jgi:ABC-type multidrug transport system ATPase subunit
MIEVQRVGKRFGRIVALDGVSLSIASGERVALVGPNGSGKTTLLRAVLGLVRVDGRVLVDGIDVARAPQRALASIAYIPQVAPPFEATVGDLVGVWSTLRSRPVEAVSLRAARLGLDLARCAGSRFRDLSGGTKQKVLAAMALACDAPVLVCDEPTASLDETSRAAFFEQVRARSPGSVVLLCSHRADELVNMVTRVVELREGRLHADGPAESATRKGGAR